MSLSRISFIGLGKYLTNIMQFHSSTIHVSTLMIKVS
jgi:hypothetical protein